MDSHDRSADGPASSPLRGVRIVLTDDHQVLRGGLRLILDAEPDFEVVGEAGDVESGGRDVSESGGGQPHIRGPDRSGAWD